jgi:hypothetical protein
MGRKPRYDRPVRWNIRIPSTIHEAIMSRLYDEGQVTSEQSGRSRLIEMLLREWLLKQTGTELRFIEIELSCTNCHRDGAFLVNIADWLSDGGRIPGMCPDCQMSSARGVGGTL